MQKRTTFFISDGTGITAETLGHSLITQFDAIHFEKIVIPYVDTPEKAHEIVERIQKAYEQDQVKPIIFATFVNAEIHNIIMQSTGLLIDFFQTFIHPLEKELQAKSSHTIGRSHSVRDFNEYKIRIDAINYVLSYDDGTNTHGYDKADIILIGVSRSGKTPICLYLGLQFGIRAANYPLIEEDLEKQQLPDSLEPYQSKLFGLTIDIERLQTIRQERRPNSPYASLSQCAHETTAVEALFKHNNIPYINTTIFSIEEIATKILAMTRLKRRLY